MHKMMIDTIRDAIYHTGAIVGTFFIFINFLFILILGKAEWTEPNRLILLGEFFTFTFLFVFTVHYAFTHGISNTRNNISDERNGMV